VAEAEKTKESRKGKRSRIGAGAAALRNRIASVVWLIAVVCALFLAVGALLIALDANQDNPVVAFVLDGAAYLDGPFSRENGIFTFSADQEARGALVNWGIAAVLYLVAGRILDRVIRP